MCFGILIGNFIRLKEAQCLSIHLQIPKCILHTQKKIKLLRNNYSKFNMNIIQLIITFFLRAQNIAIREN